MCGRREEEEEAEELRKGLGGPLCVAFWTPGYAFGLETVQTARRCSSMNDHR